MSLPDPHDQEQRAPGPPPDVAASSVAIAPCSATGPHAAAALAPSSTFPPHSGPLLEVGFWADPRDTGDHRPNPALLVDEEWGRTVAALAVALYVRSGFLESFELGYSFCRLGCCSDASKPAESGRRSSRGTPKAMEAGTAVVAEVVAAAGGAAAPDRGRNNEDAHRSAAPENGGSARDKFMGCTTLTDGKYVWPEGLAHYVTEHAVRPPEEFVEYALENLQALREAQEGGRLRWDVDARGVGRTVPLSPGTAVFLRDKTTLGIALPPEPEVRKGMQLAPRDAGSSKGGLCWRLLSRQV